MMAQDRSVCEPLLPFRSYLPRLRKGNAVTFWAGDDAGALACASHVASAASDADPRIAAMIYHRMDLFERFLAGVFRLLASPTTGLLAVDDVLGYLVTLSVIEWDVCFDLALYAGSHLTRAMFYAAGDGAGSELIPLAADALGVFTQAAMRGAAAPLQDRLVAASGDVVEADDWGFIEPEYVRIADGWRRRVPLLVPSDRIVDVTPVTREER